MPTPRISLDTDAVEQVPAPIRAGFDALRTELGVADHFPDEVEQAAARVAAAGALQVPGAGPRTDRTGLEFVTIDPVGSMDLDQAMFLERDGEGYRVWYAIADVAAWAEPGGVIDAEAHRRGQTFYAPVNRSRLHPAALSEGAASLLDDGRPRPALVWQVCLDAAGAQTSASVERALVRSRARLDYPAVQQVLDGTPDASGRIPSWIGLLEEIGRLREQQEVLRGGVSLNLPEQEIVADGDVWRIEYRSPLACEGWNAQISMLTGMAAAEIMLAGKVGILRTLPAADEHSVARLRATAKGLGIAWPDAMGYPDFVRSLDVSQPRHLAMMTACTSLFRGAAYTLVDADSAGRDLRHNALAANYAHCTAPLRRLVDRYVGEVCVHLCAGTPVPAWVLDALAALPAEMADSDHRARKFERGVTDLVEALVLSTMIGQEFTGTVVEYDEKHGRATISIPEPATETELAAPGRALGDELRVRLASVDLEHGTVVFESVATA